MPKTGPQQDDEVQPESRDDQEFSTTSEAFNGSTVTVAPAVTCLDETAFVPEQPPREPDVEARLHMHRLVWKLAWPSVLTMSLQTFNSFIDRGFVGRLGPDSLAAVGAAGQLFFLVMSIGMSLSIGATALVARFAGAKELGQAKVAANQSLMLSLLTALLCMAVFYPVRGLMVHGIIQDPAAANLGMQYLTITLLGIPALFIMLILSGVYRGLGDTVTPLLISIGINVIHLGGDFLLIFGHWGFPKLGLRGGGIALATSQCIGAIFYLAAIGRSQVAGMIAVRRKLELEWVRRILNIGVPAAVQNLSRILSMLAFTGLLSRTFDGTAAVGALTIGLTSESIAFMPGFGFSTAASTLTGQNLGAHRPDRADAAAWAAFLQGLSVMCIMGIVFYVFAPEFVHIFTYNQHDTQPLKTAHVVKLAVSYLRISAFSEPFLAMGMILIGALNGAGDSKSPAIASFITMWGIRLPFAYFAAYTLGLGAIGGWYAMAMSTVANGLVILWMYKNGKWKRTQV